MPKSTPSLPASRRSSSLQNRTLRAVACALGLLPLTATAVNAQKAPRPEVIAYVFPNFPDDRPITATDIPAAQLTRINYSFALVKNGQVLEGAPQDAANLKVLRTVRAAHPGLKLVISVGGWLGSGEFSEAALTPASRTRFVESAFAFVKRYDLDGLDIDWEYPGMPGATTHFRPEDGANFNALLRQLRERFDAKDQGTRKPLLLTIAAGSTLGYLQHTSMGEAQRYLDSVNLMAYDFYEPGEGKPTRTGNHSPLFADPADPQKASTDAMVQAYEQAGVPAAKLVLGVPFYGHGWGNVPPTDHGLFQMGTADPTLHTGYPDIQAMLQHGATRYWDEAAQVPYLYNASTRQFVSYEDAESLRRKCAYLREQKLGGIMFWQLFSDPTGTLLNTIHQALSDTQPTAEVRP